MRNKLFLSILALFVLFLGGCSPYHNVNVNIEIENATSGFVEIAFDISESSLRSPDTLESVQGTLIELLQQSDNIQNPYLSSKIEDGTLFINYKEPFASLEELTNVLARISKEEIEIELESGGDPLMNPITVNGLSSNSYPFMGWIYSDIKEQNLFGDNSNSISDYLRSYVSVTCDEESYNPASLTLNRPEVIEEVKQTITVLSKGVFNVDHQVVMKKSETLNADAIEAFFAEKISALEEESINVELSVSEEDDQFRYTFIAKGLTQMQIKTLFQKTLQLWVDVEFDLMTDFEGVDGLGYLQNQGVDITNKRDVNKYALLNFSVYDQNSPYQPNIRKLTTIFDVSDYIPQAYQGSPFEVENLSTNLTYEKGRFTVDGTIANQDLVLRVDDAFITAVLFILKLMLGILLIVGGFFGFKHYQKQRPEKPIENIPDQPTKVVESIPSQPTKVIENIKPQPAVVVESISPQPAKVVEEVEKQPLINVGFLKTILLEGIKDKRSYVPLGLMLALLIIVNFIVKGLINDSVVSLIKDYIPFDLSEVLAWLVMLFIVPTGMKITVSLFGLTASVTIIFGLITVTSIMMLGTFYITKLLNRKANIEETQDKLFARCITSVGCYLLLVLLVGTIGKSVVGVQFNGLFVYPLLTISTLGFFIAYQVSYTHQESEIFDWRFHVVMRHLLEKLLQLAGFSLLLVALFMLNGPKSTEINLGSILVSYLHIIHAVLMIGLGGRMAGGAINEQASFGLFGTTDASLWIVLLMISILFLMFFDFERLYKRFRQPDPMKFSLKTTAVVMVVILLFSYLCSVQLVVDESNSMKLGFALDSLPMVGIIVFAASYLTISFLANNPYLRLINQKYLDMIEKVKNMPKKA